MITFESLDLPVVLAQPDSDRGWVRTREATWSELMVARDLRWQTVHDVTEECDMFVDATEVLRPLMERHPTLTVAEALAVLAGKKVAS